MHEERSSKISDGIIVLSLTVYGYLAVFFYELGYARAFGIPRELINPSLSNLLTVGFMSLTFFGIVYLYLNILYMIANEKSPNSPYKTLIFKHGIFVIVGGFVAFYTYFDWRSFTLFIIPFFLLLIDLIQPLFRNEKEYSRSLEEWLNAREPEQLAHEYANKNSKSTLLVIILALYLLPVLGSVGYGTALRKEEFPVVGDYAVLKVYGYQGVAAKYDKNSNEILSEYKLINLNGSEFTVAHLGELRKADN